MAGDTTGPWKDLFNNLLIVDSLRGTHSTGAAMIDRFKNEMATVKAVGHPFNLIWSKEYQDLMKTSAKVYIGHNRYATLGKHTEDNAHPFLFETLVGAHNGTLEKASIKCLHNHDKYDTDSQALYSHMNEYGVENTIPLLEGAWALTWYDKIDNTINMIRNNKRPLHYAYSEDRCTLLWASEMDMLKMVIGRSYKKVKDDQWYVVPEDTHLKWEVPDSIAAKFDAPQMKELKGIPPRTTVFGYGRGGYSGGYYGHYGNNFRYDTYGDDDYSQYYRATDDKDKDKAKQDAKAAADNVFAFPRPQKRKDTTKFRPPYKDHKGKIINKKQFEELTACGCVFCGDNTIEWGEFIHPLKSLDSGDVFLCEACYNDEEIFDICVNLI